MVDLDELVREKQLVDASIAELETIQRQFRVSGLAVDHYGGFLASQASRSKKLSEEIRETFIRGKIV